MSSPIREFFVDRPERFDQDLANIKEGLKLLGIKPCSSCGKFFSSTKAGDIFSCYGETVCYNCLKSWWAAYSVTLDLATKNAFEQKIMRWLIDYHDAEVVRAPAHGPSTHLEDFRLALNCHECAGTGLLGKGKCRHCGGNKMIWVVVPSRQA